MDDLRAFSADVDSGSFKEAANILHITPFALSRRLAILEDDLGVRFLDRTTRCVLSSLVGEEFLAEACRIIKSFQNSIKQIRDLISARIGSVSIATNMTIAETLLLRIICDFRQNNPDIRINISESSSPQALARVLNQECEFAIAQFGKGHSDMAFEPLLKNRFVLVSSQDHPLTSKVGII